MVPGIYIASNGLWGRGGGWVGGWVGGWGGWVYYDHTVGLKQKLQSAKGHRPGTSDGRSLEFTLP